MGASRKKRVGKSQKRKMDSKKPHCKTKKANKIAQKIKFATFWKRNDKKCIDITDKIAL